MFYVFVDVYELFQKQGTLKPETEGSMETSVNQLMFTSRLYLGSWKGSVLWVLLPQGYTWVHDEG